MTTTAREKNAVRVLGPRKRIFGGWTRKDRIKLNEKELRGYVLVTRKNGTVTEQTVFGNRVVDGYDWVWLSKRNGRTGLRVKEYQEPSERLVA